jgi:hypothetical protein
VARAERVAKKKQKKKEEMNRDFVTGHRFSSDVTVERRAV